MPRLAGWGSIGGVLAGVLLIAGYIIALLLAPGSDAANVTGTWLTLFGFVALIFAAVGLHEATSSAGSGLAGSAAILTIVGSVLMVAVTAIALESAYGLSADPAYLEAELIGLPVAGGGALLIGVVLLGVAVIRTEGLPAIAGGLLVAAALAFGAAAVTFAVDAALAELFYVGGILLGVGVAWSGASVSRRRP